MRLEKQQLRDQAGQFYDRAADFFRQRQDAIRQSLQEMPKTLNPATQSALIDQREQLRAEYIQVQLVAATITYEKAALVKEQTEKHHELLKQAAEAYGQTAEKYRGRLAGLYALLYQGRCYEDLGDRKQALALYEQLLEQPGSSDELRPLITKAVRRAMECRMHQTVGQLDRAIQEGEKWIGEIRQDEQEDPDWLELRWWVGQANYTKAKLPDTSPPERQRLLANARGHLTEVSRSGGAWAEDAQGLLAQLYGAGRSEARRRRNGGKKARAEDL